MDTLLPDDVRSFADVARHRLSPLGGPRLALAAETDEAARARAGQALASLGIDDLDVRAGGDELLAGAALCRAAGAASLPWPVVETLLRRDGARLALVSGDDPRVDHGDLAGPWLGVDLDGRCHRLSTGARGAAKLGPFLVPASLEAPVDDVPGCDVALHLVLGSWRILGTLEAAMRDVVAHVTARTQFGQPLAAFQALRFRVADTTVAVRGLEELAKHAVSRWSPEAPRTVVADALGLRLHAVATARSAMRTAHQLHGAVGFCDETDVSVANRHLQPSLCLPVSEERLATRLAAHLDDYEGLCR